MAQDPKEIAKAAVQETLIMLGVDVHDPLKTQQDFANMRKVAKLMEDPELTADIEFVRRLRGASEVVRDTAWKTIAKWVATGLLGLLLLGTKDWWRSHIGL